ncbi:hypothetical protein LIA77_01460 [Sarocladium implicatum]|nr:hypothetical protein LIA77_01460 [Sarocladium implicatum]
MQGHDELAMLFSRNLTFNPEVQARPQEPTPAPPPAPAQPIIYSISQHYHHSAHMSKAKVKEETMELPEDPPRPSSEPPQGDTLLAESQLRMCNIDPATLTPAQLQLFRTADDQQKQRLAELWLIAPPTKSGDIPSLAWSSTSVEHEETLARMRYEREQAQATTTVQSSDGTWAAQRSASDSEPYMASGYEELMRREQQREAQSRAVYNHYGNAIGSRNYSTATDPVFMGPDSVRAQEQMSMATQYGAFEHFRSTDAMDVM